MDLPKSLESYWVREPGFRPHADPGDLGEGHTDSDIGGSTSLASGGEGMVLLASVQLNRAGPPAQRGSQRAQRGPQATTP